MRYRVIITQALKLDTVIEASVDASLAELTELALQKTDYGIAAFECEWAETNASPLSDSDQPLLGTVRGHDHHPRPAH